MPLRAIISKQGYWVVCGKDPISLKIMRPCFPESSYKVSERWIKLVGNSIRLPSAYVLFTKSKYFEVSKNPNKKFLINISTIYGRSYSFANNQYFFGGVKTNMSHKKSYF
jgi:hypothetical protein